MISLHPGEQREDCPAVPLGGSLMTGAGIPDKSLPLHHPEAFPSTWEGRKRAEQCLVCARQQNTEKKTESACLAWCAHSRELFLQSFPSLPAAGMSSPHPPPGLPGLTEELLIWLLALRNGLWSLDSLKTAFHPGKHLGVSSSCFNYTPRCLMSLEGRRLPVTALNGEEKSIFKYSARARYLQ